MTDFFRIASVVSGLFPVLTAIFVYRRLDKVLKLAAAFFLMNVLSDLLQVSTLAMGAKNNQPVLHLNIILSVLFFIAIYYYALIVPGLKKLILITGGIAVLGLLYCLLFINGIWDYPTWANTILSLLAIFFSIVYFIQLLNRQEFVHIEKLGFFWINSAVLFYFSVTIFLFMLFPKIIASHQEDYYIINHITNITTNIVFSVGLLCKPQKTN